MELHEFLSKQAVGKGESYDDIIKRLLKELWGAEINEVEVKSEAGN